MLHDNITFPYVVIVFSPATFLSSRYYFQSTGAMWKRKVILRVVIFIIVYKGFMPSRLWKVTCQYCPIVHIVMCNMG